MRVEGLRGEGLMVGLPPSPLLPAPSLLEGTGGAISLPSLPSFPFANPATPML